MPHSDVSFLATMYLVTPSSLAAYFVIALSGMVCLAVVFMTTNPLAATRIGVLDDVLSQRDLVAGYTGHNIQRV